MWILPVIAPGWFPPAAIDGTSTRALWLEAMGLVQLAIGAGYLARQRVLPAVWQWLAAAPAQWSDAPVPKAAAAISQRGHRPWYALAMAKAALRPKVSDVRHGRVARDTEKLAHFVARLRELPYGRRGQAVPALQELIRQNLGPDVANGSREAA